MAGRKLMPESGNNLPGLEYLSTFNITVEPVLTVRRQLLIHTAELHFNHYPSSQSHLRRLHSTLLVHYQEQNTDSCISSLACVIASKYPEAIPLERVTAEVVAEAIMEVVSRTGLPDSTPP